MDYVKLGKLIRDGRKKKDYTQYFVAGMLHVTPQNVSSWERGKSKMDIDNYIRLCNLLDLDFVSTVVFCSDNPCMPHFPVLFDADGNRTDGYQLISPDESSILSSYRNLSDQGKEYVKQTIDMASRVYIKSDNLPDVGKYTG